MSRRARSCSRSLAFTAEAGGYPAPTVQWQISTNGGTTYTNIAGATSTTYRFTASSSKYGDLFRAVFTNSNGTAASQAAVLSGPAPLAAPVITANPANQSVAAGATATFTAAASGNPTPTVQWQVSTNAGKSYRNIPEAAATTYRVTAGKTNAGHLYRAVFTNAKGRVATKPGTLTVLPDDDRRMNKCLRIAKPQAAEVAFTSEAFPYDDNN
jgi:hypothetical protein